MEKRNKVKIDILIELIEIIAPIALYVIFEAIHKHQLKFLITSPEWGIASLFLFFIGIKNYISNIRKISIKKDITVNETTIQMWVFIRFFLITISILVTLFSVLQDNIYLKYSRIVIFIFAIFTFTLLNYSAKKQ